MDIQRRDPRKTRRLQLCLVKSDTENGQQKQLQHASSVWLACDSQETKGQIDEHAGQDRDLPASCPHSLFPKPE